MGKLHLFELRSGHILLDGVTIRGIRECEFSIKENDSLVSIAAFLTTINQISIIITAKQLWMQQQQLQQQLERLQKERSEL